MPAIQSHRDLIVWQKAVDLVEHIYRLTECFPAEERIGLVFQIKRAAVSVPANIAEGYARSSRKNYAQFLSIAKGSLMEVEALLTIAQRLGYVKAAGVVPSRALIEEISKMLTRLRERLLNPTRPV